ncbi:MAG: hypothetical protein HYU28_03990 [Actinobacteria bacterium]|nr:hypothetical protein [Actinomycetota bacterium]
MRIRALVLPLAAVLLPPLGPASAKAPSVVGVRGPGIEGEVDLHSLDDLELDLLVLPAARQLTEAQAVPKPPGPGPAYRFTWYSFQGGVDAADLAPDYDRIAYYPQAAPQGLVEVLEHSAVFGTPGVTGWYVPEAGLASALAAAVAAASAPGVHGPSGYAFQSADPEGFWVPVGAGGAEPAPDRDVPDPGIESLRTLRTVAIAAMPFVFVVVMTYLRRRGEHAGASV